MLHTSAFFIFLIPLFLQKFNATSDVSIPCTFPYDSSIFIIMPVPQPTSRIFKLFLFLRYFLRNILKRYLLPANHQYFFSTSYITLYSLVFIDNSFLWHFHLFVIKQGKS